jgi:hypothetical protein
MVNGRSGHVVPSAAKGSREVRARKDLPVAALVHFAGFTEWYDPT